MAKITVGRMRKKSNGGAFSGGGERRGAADAVFLSGAAAVCVMLTLPMLSLSGERIPEERENAVPVMSTAAEQPKEEVSAPSAAEPEEKWSFYDYLGELVAGLLSGQG